MQISFFMIFHYSALLVWNKFLLVKISIKIKCHPSSKLVGFLNALYFCTSWHRGHFLFVSQKPDGKSVSCYKARQAMCTFYCFIWAWKCACFSAKQDPLFFHRYITTVIIIFVTVVILNLKVQNSTWKPGVWDLDGLVRTDFFLFCFHRWRRDRETFRLRLWAFSWCCWQAATFFGFPLASAESGWFPFSPQRSLRTIHCQAPCCFAHFLSHTLQRKKSWRYHFSTEFNVSRVVQKQ